MATWRLGTGCADCTPAAGTVLGGGAFGPATAVGDELQARAFLLDDGADRTLILNVDCLGFEDADADRIRQDCAQLAGCPVAAVMLSATHTHGAAATIGLEAWSPRDRAAVAQISRACTAAVEQALRRLLPVELQYRQTRAGDLARTRSRFSDGVDPTLEALACVDEAGCTRALLVAWGCHPVWLHGTGLITADLLGPLRAQAHEQLGGQVAVGLLLGACGDVNPRRFGDWADLDERHQDCTTTAATLLDRLLAAAPRQLATGLGAEERLVQLPVLPPPSETHAAHERDLLERQPEPDDPWERASREARRAWLRTATARRGRHSRPVRVQLIRCGGLAVIGIAAELFAPYGRQLRSRSEAPCLLATLCNGYAGYLTTPDAVRAGTYEAEQVACMLGKQPFAPAAAGILVDAIHSLIAGAIPCPTAS